MTILSDAPCPGQRDSVNTLLNTHQVDVNERGLQAPLICAARNGDDALVKALLAADSIGVNANDPEGCTALSLAVSGMHVAVVKRLLAHDKVDKDKRDFLGQTPLLVAVMLRAPSEEAREKRKAIIDALLDTGMCSIYAADMHGNTPWNRAKAGGDQKLASNMKEKPGPKRVACLRDKD